MHERVGFSQVEFYERGMEICHFNLQLDPKRITDAFYCWDKVDETFQFCDSPVFIF